MWATTTAAVLIVGVCVLSSLGQAYYSMMVFPAVFTVAGRYSVFHTPFAWLGIILCLSPLTWVVDSTPVTGRWLDTFLPTAGWIMFLVATAAWICATAAPLSTTGRTVPDGQLDSPDELRRLD